MSETSLKMEREIDTESLKIQAFVDKLKKDDFLIPTFQREFVWDKENILRLWDSIFKFYPIGSILYWETHSFLHTHRRIGGFIFPHDQETVRKFKEWAYILDGQQRATTLLVTLSGGKGRVEGEKDFDYTVYLNAKTGRFFFTEEIEWQSKFTNPAFLIRLRDVPSWGISFYKNIASEKGYDEKIEKNLEQIEKVFKDYKLTLIRIRGVEVNEVCDIFERINQEGKKLDPVDIIVARTYRNEDPTKGIAAFYLRDNLKNLSDTLSSRGVRFNELRDLTTIQMVSLCLRKEKGEPRFGITPAYLYNLKTDDFENNWSRCEKTILETVKFLLDLKVQGPNMLPFVYTMLPICYYLHQNSNPDRNTVKKWFWSVVFGRSEFRRSTDVYRYCRDFFDKLGEGHTPVFPNLELSKKKLVTTYYYRDAFSRAVLCFLAYQNPRDFSDYDAEVLDHAYLLLSSTPNLHHIFPQNFLANNPKFCSADAPMDSLMNICFLRRKTNIDIRDDNPLYYFKNYKGTPYFEETVRSHLIPTEFLEKEKFEPEDYANFLAARSELFCEKLQKELPDIKVRIVK